MEHFSVVASSNFLKEFYVEFIFRNSSKKKALGEVCR